MTTATQNPSREFTNAVRLALADLPAEEVDELTDGLEADLAERAEDETAFGFGDPVAYANELRAAAGLPPRSAQRPATLGVALARAARDFIDGLRGLPSHPTLGKLAAFFVSLRPLWWIVRAWAIYGILTWLFHVPSLVLTPLTFVLAAGTLITSIQFGRGKWLPRGWMRTALLIVNIALVVGSPVILIATSNAWQSETEAAYNSGQLNGVNVDNGLRYNGHTITNIFAYDADGKPLTQVQLYDQNGKPLYTVPEPWGYISAEPFLVPNASVKGRGGWNVYPLGYVTNQQLRTDGTPKPNAVATQSLLQGFVPPPLKNAKPATTPNGTATPTPTATPAP